ncbi:MAG: hypothetical protein V4641_05670 [Pseudomonadota bacterium]
MRPDDLMNLRIEAARLALDWQRMEQQPGQLTVMSTTQFKHRATAIYDFLCGNAVADNGTTGMPETLNPTHHRQVRNDQVKMDAHQLDGLGELASKLTELNITTVGDLAQWQSEALALHGDMNVGDLARCTIAMENIGLRLGMTQGELAAWIESGIDHGAEVTG